MQPPHVFVYHRSCLSSNLFGFLIFEIDLTNWSCFACYKVIWETWGISEECREDKDLLYIGNVKKNCN
ncbi:hypothetical protein HanHA89_Chr02g0043511 [Helianthus annuus]|nr:hypothetical protein HanHA89_Chr02g0043511 [Helianthus annuus]